MYLRTGHVANTISDHTNRNNEKEGQKEKRNPYRLELKDFEIILDEIVISEIKLGTILKSQYLSTLCPRLKTKDCGNKSNKKIV